MKIPLLLCGLALASEAAPLRVVTFNIETNRDSDGNVSEALNDPGTNDYNTVRDILARIDADVVCLQELANADIAGGTNGGTNSDVHALATELGLPYVLIPTNAGVFDFTLRNAILSRYPFLASDEVGTSSYQESIFSVGEDGETAKDVTRAIPAVSVDVPGAAAPATLCTLHAKSATGPSDRFRRAVELAKLKDYFSNNGLNAADNIIVTGDFNLSSFDDTFTAEPENGMPSTWNRGTEIALPISYSTDPDFYFPAPFNLVAVDALAVNGNDATFESGSTIDFILSSPAISVVGSEIYRSSLDVSNSDGLTKVGDPLPTATSGEASDHYAVFADFILADAEPVATSYSLTDLNPQVQEGFDGFNGLNDPAPWSTDSLVWRGLFDDSTLSGGYAIDTNGDSSVGLITPEGSTPFSATFDNDTSATIEALDISYLARQLSASSPGTTDTLEASLSVAGSSPIALPSLDFTASPSASAPTTETLSETVTGLAIASGQSFDLTLTATRGADSGGIVASEVFINELHYDNTGTDEGEFVELVVSPGFMGSLSDISLLLYRDTGTVYATHELATFDNFASPGTANGYQIFYKSISGIQNGGSDGLAVAVDGAATSLLSYEGTLTATDGAAAGMTSVEIGSQPSSGPVGAAALGLTGSGVDSSELTWVTFGTDVAHSPGTLNSGQSLTGTSPLPGQAFSFDDLSVSIASPSDNDDDGEPDSSDLDDDNDLLPDLVEVSLGLDPFLADSDMNGVSDFDEDSDGDGQSNGSEAILTLTDPTNPNDFFQARLVANPANPEQLLLIFATLTGRSYQISGGSNPSLLSPLTTYLGDGNDSSFTINPTQNPAFFFSVQVTFSSSD